MWDNLKASIASVVRTNNNQEITGANLQDVLNTIVNSVGANATFAGIAIPSTNPGTPDGPVFYIACKPGIYSNFNLTLVDGLYVLENKTGSWVGTRINIEAAFEALIGYYNAVLNGASITVPNATTYRLTVGGDFKLKMPAAGTTDTTLTIGNATDIPIWYNGAAVSSDNTWEAGEIISVFYDGTRFMASNSQGGGGKAKKIKYDNLQSRLSAENVQEALDELNSFNKVWENDGMLNGARFIHTDGRAPITTGQPAWRVTGMIDLYELKGCDIHFFRIYKSALDMLAYALYARLEQASFINGDYVSDAITQQSETLTWDSLNVDEILKQYPTARYIRFTLHTSFLNQPYADTGFKKVLETVKSSTRSQNMDSALGMGWTSSKRIDADGGISDCSEPFLVSGLVHLSQLSEYILVGYNCFSSKYDIRTWALYDSNNVCIAVSEPNDSYSFKRRIIIDPQELLVKYPSATQIRFGCNINFLLELVEKGSVIAKAYQNEINAARPSKGGLDNFTFAAGGSGIINIVSNTDSDVTQYETLLVNFAQVLKIGNYYVCFYYANSGSGGEYNQVILCAYSSNGTTWTRGFPPNVTPPVAGTNKLFDNTASGYKAITESCWCRVPDKDYPYRMIANRNMSGSNKSCWMWKSADGYHYELMGQILGDAYRPDTQYSAVVRGNIIKLYLRISETVGSQYKRSIAVAYLDLDGNILTPPYKLIYDYRYTSAACVLDNTRELLIPTWFANNINSAPKTENAYLETFIVEGDKYEKIDTNINDCLNDDTLWAAVAPDFVSINNEQYICVNERNTDHASSPDKSSIKLVKVTRT